MTFSNQVITLKAGELPSKRRSRRAVAPAAPASPAGTDLQKRLLKIIQYCQYALTQTPDKQLLTLLAISAVTDGAFPKKASS